jgi:hypothetical protein
MSDEPGRSSPASPSIVSELERYERLRRADRGELRHALDDAFRCGEIDQERYKSDLRTLRHLHPPLPWQAYEKLRDTVVEHALLALLLILTGVSIETIVAHAFESGYREEVSYLALALYFFPLTITAALVALTLEAGGIIMGPLAVLIAGGGVWVEEHLKLKGKHLTVHHVLCSTSHGHISCWPHLNPLLDWPVRAADWTIGVAYGYGHTFGLTACFVCAMTGLWIGSLVADNLNM